MGRRTKRPGCLLGVAWRVYAAQQAAACRCVAVGQRRSCKPAAAPLLPPSAPAINHQSCPNHCCLTAMPRTCTTTRWPPCCMVRSTFWLPHAWPCKGGSMRCPRLVPAALHDTHPAPAHAIRPANRHASPPPAVPAAGESALPPHFPSTGAIHTLMGLPHPQASPATCACLLA